LLLLSVVIVAVETIAVRVELFGIHRDAVQLDRLEDLLLHGLKRGVVRQCQVEEAGVCLGHCEIMLVWPCAQVWLDEETTFLSDEVLIRRWKTLLSPDELDELLLFRLRHLV